MAPKKKSTRGLKNPPAEIVEPLSYLEGVGRPTKYSPEFCSKLIEHMAGGLPFESFGGRAMNVSTRTLYAWAESYPEFQQAKEVGQRLLVEFYANVARNIAAGVIPPPPVGSGAMMTRGNAAMATYLLRVYGKKAGFDIDEEIGILPGTDTGTVSFEYYPALVKDVSAKDKV